MRVLEQIWRLLVREPIGVRWICWLNFRRHANRSHRTASGHSKRSREISSARSRVTDDALQTLKLKGEVNRSDNESIGNNVIPFKRRWEKRERNDGEYEQSDALLQNL